MKLASSLNVSGNVVSSGRGYALNVTLERSVGCQGTISLGGKGSLEFLWIGKTFWIKPDKLFFTSQGMTDPATLRMLYGRWITTPPSNDMTKDFSGFCNISQLAGAFGGGSDPTLKRLARTTIGDVLVQEMGDPGQAGTVYVSVAQQPEVIRIVDQEKEGGTLNFGSYNQPVRLIAPPASETFDGSKVGM